MISQILAWAIFFLPLSAFLIISLVIRPFVEPRFPSARRASGAITISALLISFLLSIWIMTTIEDSSYLDWDVFSWITLGSFNLTIGILLDPLTSVMLIVVTGVSLLVQLYSYEYMKDDQGFSRYFSFMALFTSAMLGLVLSRNIVQMFVFWELVGLSSYLLIGFWFFKPSAAAAAKKAFLITRLGDVGFLIGILYLASHGDILVQAVAAEGLEGVKNFNPLDIVHLNQFAGEFDKFLTAGLVTQGIFTWVALGLFAGAAGKSAQFPLHTWLPDAMEGPTPVSALIHAATMVAAGVFLVARLFPVFETSVISMNVIALVGAFTAVFAASMGMVMNDIKRVLAYSTVSQLGYMVLALGIGVPAVAMFHLFTHAFFKALLFLGAGSVSHAAGTYDMRQMGGLRKVMPVTYATFMIGSLSLIGVFPLAGFWSKDEILATALNQSGLVGVVVVACAFAAVLMTAFYTTRVIILTFHGEFRGMQGSESHLSANKAQDSHAQDVHLAESPFLMVLPLIVLSIPAVTAGFLANPINDTWGLGIIPAHWFSHLLHGHTVKFSMTAASISTLLALVGIGFSYLRYAKPSRVQKKDADKGMVYRVLSNKYYMDWLYEDVVTVGLFYRKICTILYWIDRFIIDGLVTLTGWLVKSCSPVIVRVQNGQLQTYGTGISLGILGLVIAYRVLGL